MKPSTRPKLHAKYDRARSAWARQGRAISVPPVATFST